MQGSLTEILVSLRWGVCAGDRKMDVIVWGIAVLFLGLAWSTYSMSRSFFEKGRIRGFRECVREMRKGALVQLNCEEQKLPDDLRKAISTLEILLDRGPLKTKSNTDPIHAQLWTLGRTLAEACWLKGHAAGVRRKAPEEGKIRIDLSAIELLQLGGLANLGFQHMMPNARLFEFRRFTGKDDAIEATRALTRLEAAIPKEHRPDLLRHAEGRMQMIDTWWTPMPERAIA
jgi:hypothetical protein